MRTDDTSEFPLLMQRVTYRTASSNRADFDCVWQLEKKAGRIKKKDSKKEGNGTKGTIVKADFMLS